MLIVERHSTTPQRRQKNTDLIAMCFEKALYAVPILALFSLQPANATEVMLTCVYDHINPNTIAPDAAQVQISGMHLLINLEEQKVWSWIGKDSERVKKKEVPQTVLFFNDGYIAFLSASEFMPLINTFLLDRKLLRLGQSTLSKIDLDDQHRLNLIAITQGVGAENSLVMDCKRMDGF